MKINFDVEDIQNWIDAIEMGVYELYTTPIGASPEKVMVRLRRKRGVKARPIPSWMKKELSESEAKEFIKQIKKRAGID